MVLVAVQLSVPGLYLPPVFRIAARLIVSAPDDHFAAGPNCRVIRIARMGALVVLVAVQLFVLGLYRPPVLKLDDARQIRPRRSFHCRSTLLCVTSAEGAFMMLVAVQAVGAGIVSPASIKIAAAMYRRPRRSFHCRSRLPCMRHRTVGALVVLVAVQLLVPGLYLPPVLNADEVNPRPRRSFRCRSKLPCDSRALGALVVLVAIQLSVLGLYLPPVFKQPVQVVNSSPNDHFIAGPDCCVILSGRRRVGGAGGCPTVGAGIVSPASVQIAAIISAPDDHFTAGPDCRVSFVRKERCSGGSCPGIIRASMAGDLR